MVESYKIPKEKTTMAIVEIMYSTKKSAGYCIKEA
jgi:hypothetical protein